MKPHKTATELDQTQKSQSVGYSFPYHYIPHFENNQPRMSRSWAWAHSWLAAAELIQEHILACKKENHKHLDLGCGDGALINTLAKSIPSVEFTGIDYDKEAIKWALLLREAQVVFHCMDIVKEGVSALSGTFDSCSLVEVIEHIPPSTLDEFISVASSFLKPGGKLFITVPHSNKPVQSKHYQHFSFDSLTKVIPRCLDVETVHGFEVRGRFVRNMQRLVFNRHWILDSPIFNNFIIRKLKILSGEDRCGRIFMVCRKSG